jgi:hypothetical protein
MASLDAEKPAPERSGNRPLDIDSLAASDISRHNEITKNSQAQNEPRSAAVAAAIERNHKRLLAIKRGSIASLAGMAGASLTPTFKTDRTLRDPANTFPDRPSS